jgi:16S rRNA (uracil1498-N3)-methyltransferase
MGSPVPRYDFSAQRLFVDEKLAADQQFALTSPQANYLLSVLRMRDGDQILVFNGRDGEWLAEIRGASKRKANLTVLRQTRAQESGPDLDCCFAPLKHARLDYMVQKAVEMGARRLVPVLTKRTQVQRVNLTRMQANAIEAAEQCGILTIPEIAHETSVTSYLAERSPHRLLIFCDEEAEIADPLAALRDAKIKLPEASPLALLIGPEGGFDPAERVALLAAPNVLAISLGPRILRADTAAVAGLALVQAVLGDWACVQLRTTMSP